MHVTNFDYAHRARFVAHQPSPAAVPTPTSEDLARLGELVGQAIDTGLGAALEHRPVLDAERDALGSAFGVALARMVAARVGAVL